ncbi:MAG TPA: TetR/AcrR family transcriptional regulator [Mycobacteriales bacterium]|nr:TetR/AcrR family transcriptional regulator [Mycobacteriales bacterium]
MTISLRRSGDLAPGGNYYVQPADRVEGQGGAVDSAVGARREQILVAAVQLFRSRGYDRTSLREIAASLGLSKSGLYHHFPSKDDLLAAAVDPLLDRLGDLVDSSPPARSAADRNRFLAAYLDILIQHRDVVGLIGADAAVRAHPRIGARLAELDESLYRRLSGDGADLARQVRAAYALVGLQDTVGRFSDADPAVVRSAGLAAAAAAVAG